MGEIVHRQFRRAGHRLGRYRWLLGLLLSVVGQDCVDAGGSNMAEGGDVHDPHPGVTERKDIFGCGLFRPDLLDGHHHDRHNNLLLPLYNRV